MGTLRNRRFQIFNEKFYKFFFGVLFFLSSYNSFAQTPSLQQKLYYTCKVYGFVKYFHSNVSNCNVNWDSVLVSVLPTIESATTYSAFNDALDTMLVAAGPMALSTTYFPDTLAPDLKRNRDFTWIDTSSIFRNDVQIQLDTIKNNFRPHTNCQVIIDPTFNTLVDPWGGYLEFPNDTTLLNETSPPAYPDENHRLLLFFKYWNILRYFNPYNYALDESWDITLSNYVLPMDTVSNGNSLFLMYLNIATSLDDAHAYGLTYSETYFTPPGFYKPYISLMYTDSEYVVTQSLVTGINPGDILISVDGRSTAQWEDSLKQYYSSGNTSVMRRSVCENILCRGFDGLNETLIVADSTLTNHTFTTPCVYWPADASFFSNSYYPADSLDSISWTVMPCDIGYVNMGNLQDADVNEMYSNLQNKSAIIFDLRNYPNGTAWPIAGLIYPNSLVFANFLLPDVTYPGTYYWQAQSLGSVGNPTPYNGKVIILMNEQTQSQAEYSCMILGAMPNSIKVGSQTAGADGDVTWMQLSNEADVNTEFGWTSLGVFYPNGDSTQRIGIVPDSVVYPTAAGIRHGNDEVLNKALSIAGCNLAVQNVPKARPTMTVAPNPANAFVTIEINSTPDPSALITIMDNTGRILFSKTVENNNNNIITTSFNVEKLPAAMYFITVKTSQGNQYFKKLIKE